MKELLAAYDSGVPVPPLRERVIPVGDIAAAYALQREMTEHWQTQGRRLVGAKIGLTNPAVQEVFGVFQPDFGVLFADMAVVVVFPFVAEIRATPADSLAASASTEPGSTFQRSFPGNVVPPPRPAARETAPTARAAIVSRARPRNSPAELSRPRL